MVEELLRRKGVKTDLGNAFIDQAGLHRKVIELVPDKVWTRVNSVNEREGKMPVYNPKALGDIYPCTPGWATPEKNGKYRIELNLRWHPNNDNIAHGILHEIGHAAEDYLSENRSLSQALAHIIGDRQGVADMFALYILEGPRLRAKIAELKTIDPRRHQAFDALYSLMRREIFDGREFKYADVAHIHKLIADEDKNARNEFDEIVARRERPISPPPLRDNVTFTDRFFAHIQTEPMANIEAMIEAMKNRGRLKD